MTPIAKTSARRRARSCTSAAAMLAAVLTGLACGPAAKARQPGSVDGQQMTGPLAVPALTVGGVSVRNPALMGFLTSNETLTVCASGCGYTDPRAAWGVALSRARLTEQLTTIRIGHGTYTETDQFYTECACGKYVQVVGDPADPGAVVLNFTHIAGTNFSGFIANGGGKIGLIDGLTINGVGAVSGRETTTGTSWAAQSYGAGVQATGGGSYIKLGSHLAINHFYYSVVADEHGMVDAPGGGVTGTDAGDVNFMARHNGTIACPGCHARRAADTTPGQTVLGCNFTAEAGGSLFIDGSDGSGSRTGAVCGLSGGHIWAHNTRFAGGLGGKVGSGGWINENAFAELTGSQFSGYAIGVYVSSGGGALIDKVTSTANGTDGFVADGGQMGGAGAVSTDNAAYGWHALHQGAIHAYGSYRLATGNKVGIGAVEKAGTLNGFPYQGSSLVIN